MTDSIEAVRQRDAQVTDGPKHKGLAQAQEDRRTLLAEIDRLEMLVERKQESASIYKAERDAAHAAIHRILTNPYRAWDLAYDQAVLLGIKDDPDRLEELNR